jgi:hypothetical protein
VVTGFRKLLSNELTRRIAFAKPMIMEIDLLDALEEYARIHHLPAGFLDTLEREAPWAYRCSDFGIADELAPELFAEVITPHQVAPEHAVGIARIFTVYGEIESPTSIPEREAAAQRIENILNTLHSGSSDGSRAAYLNTDSIASFRPTIVLPSDELPCLPVLNALVQAAAVWPFFQELVFSGTDRGELFIGDLRPQASRS